MNSKRRCRYFRVPVNIQSCWGIGYCDLGVNWSSCSGDVRFCERRAERIRIFYEEQNRKIRRETIRALP